MFRRHFGGSRYAVFEFGPRMGSVALNPARAMYRNIYEQFQEVRVEEPNELFISSQLCMKRRIGDRGPGVLVHDDTYNVSNE